MAVPKQHRSKSRQGQRRVHIFLKEPALVLCTKCGKPTRPHTMCQNCGTYRGKEVVNVLSKFTGKQKKEKAKELEKQEKHSHKKESKRES